MRDGRAGRAGLKAGDSPGDKMAERQRRSEDSSDIHFIRQRLSLVWKGLGVGGGCEVNEHTQRPITSGHEYNRRQDCSTVTASS